MGGGASSAGAGAVGDVRRSGWQARVAEGLDTRVAFVVGLGVGCAWVCVFEDDAERWVVRGGFQRRIASRWAYDVRVAGSVMVLADGPIVDVVYMVL